MKNRFCSKGVTLSYNVEGEGSPIILMHGWGCTGSTLSSIEKLLASNHKVYSVDFPGFGQSSEPTEVWGVDDYTQLIEEWVKAEKIENPIMLGHSFGGRVGILYASRNDVNKLILVDAAGVLPVRTMKYYWKVYSYKTMKKILFTLFGNNIGQSLLQKYRKNAGSSDYQSCSEMMKKVFVKVVNEDLKSVMPAIKAPTLLLWGENDTATPVRDAKIMDNLIPNTSLVIFPDAGHYSFLDKPQEFATALSTFVEK